MGKPQLSQVAIAIEILRLLSEKPHFRENLTLSLNEYSLKHNHYVEDIPQKVSRTIRQLRDCGFEIRSAPNRPYELLDSTFPVILSDEQKQALAMAAYFLSDMGFAHQASHIIRIGKLDETHLPTGVKVNFNPPVDYSEAQIEGVVHQLQDRCHKRRRFVIRYRSAQGRQRNWDCDRSELRLHQGILYLFAYTPDSFARHSPIDRNRLFRVDRIIYVYRASNVPWGRMTFPTDIFRYQMKGSLGHYKPRRLNEREIRRDIDNSWVEIEAEEENWFWFRQRLLQYGENVQLLSPKWAVEQLQEELQQASRQYSTP